MTSADANCFDTSSLILWNFTLISIAYDHKRRFCIVSLAYCRGFKLMESVGPRMYRWSVF